MPKDNPTPVERAAALYDAALLDQSPEQAERSVFKLLLLEGVPEITAEEIAKAGRLLSRAQRQGRLNH